jgi:tripartite ATP-independent transporter DctM subunit
VITALMVVAMTDMLIGVVLRYVGTWVSATLDLHSVRFFWVEEIGEYALAWLTFIGAAIAGLVAGNFSLQKLPSSLVAGSQSWVLLAIPTFVFAGSLMERCGMSYALVNLARALVGRIRGGLGMSVVLAEYFFSGISGSTIADVSAIGAMLTPPMLRAGYKREHAVSLVASATAMGILVPPAIFMIVLGQVTDTSVVAIFLAGFIPAAVTAAILMLVIFLQAHRLGWPKDAPPTRAELVQVVRESLVPMVVPVLIIAGFYFGAFTATEVGALVAAYAVAAALLYDRNVTPWEMPSWSTRARC